MTWGPNTEEKGTYASLGNGDAFLAWSACHDLENHFAHLSVDVLVSGNDPSDVVETVGYHC